MKGWGSSYARGVFPFSRLRSGEGDFVWAVIFSEESSCWGERGEIGSICWGGDCSVICGGSGEGNGEDGRDNCG